MIDMGFEVEGAWSDMPELFSNCLDGVSDEKHKQFLDNMLELQTEYNCILPDFLTMFRSDGSVSIPTSQIDTFLSELSQTVPTFDWQHR